MIAKCKDITTKINELEIRVKSISKPKLPLSEDESKRPSTAPVDSCQTNSRVKIAHHMISQIQRQMNKEMVEGSSSTSDINTRKQLNDLSLFLDSNLSTNKEHESRLTPENMKKTDFKHIFTGTTVEDCMKEHTSFPQSVKCDAEKESDALEMGVKIDQSIISIKDPPTTNQKPFCECSMCNPINKEIGKITDITVMGMMNNFTNRWPRVKSFEKTSSKLEKPLSDDDKTVDNFLIDSLRGEIEKVRHRLCEIGKRPCENQQINSSILEENTIVSINPSGDHDYQSQLVKEIKDLQMKNEELTEKLENYKNMQANSMKKAKDTAFLLSAYEEKVNALHEQALKSSKIMAHSKEKFCQILRTRNAQIKNLFHINQQLRKTLAINQEQMNQLNENYKLLKDNYKELENNDKKNQEENSAFRETMAKLQEELKLVYKECKELKEENVRFLKELSETQEGIERKYSLQFDQHKNQYQSLIMQTAQSGAKLIQEVTVISENLHSQGDDLVNFRSEVRNETFQLDLKYKKLLYQYEALVRKFREYEQFDEIKCSCIEQELKEFSIKMKEKESIILRERDELRALVEELAKAIRRNKTAIQELNSANEQQENVIDNMNAIIKMKDEQLLKYQKNIDEIKNDYAIAQKEIDTLKKILNEIDHKSLPEHQNLEKDLENLREIVNQEKDNNLIKQKIIEGHEETISELREQLNKKSNEIENKVQSLCKLRDEVSQLAEDLRYKDIDLKKEKQEKSKILHELECINTYKESLVKQISDLENIVKGRCMDDEMNQMNQQETINELEKQLRDQKEDWEVQRKVLQKDKEKALHAAKFASQKLLDTVNDFQKQMSQQKAAQTKLAMLLHGKEQQLESLTKRVRSLLPSYNGTEGILPNQTSYPQNICTSFCQIRQIFPGPEQIHHSNASIEEDSESYLEGSNSCSGCCEFSDA